MTPPTAEHYHRSVPLKRVPSQYRPPFRSGERKDSRDGERRQRGFSGILITLLLIAVLATAGIFALPIAAARSAATRHTGGPPSFDGSGGGGTADSGGQDGAESSEGAAGGVPDVSSIDVGQATGILLSEGYVIEPYTDAEPSSEPPGTVIGTDSHPEPRRRGERRCGS